MTTSLFIAKLLGPALAVLGIALLTNPARFRDIAHELMEGKAALLIVGLMTLVTGLAIVNTHNDWALGWPLIITIFGWLAVIGGIVRVTLPAQVRTIGEAMLANDNMLYFGGIANILLGGFLAYMGYLA